MRAFFSNGALSRMMADQGDEVSDSQNFHFFSVQLFLVHLSQFKPLIPLLFKYLCHLCHMTYATMTIVYLQKQIC